MKLNPNMLICDGGYLNNIAADVGYEECIVTLALRVGSRPNPVDTPLPLDESQAVASSFPFPPPPGPAKRKAESQLDLLSVKKRSKAEAVGCIGTELVEHQASTHPTSGQLALRSSSLKRSSAAVLKLCDQKRMRVE
ncbi:hypothetical protein QTG54_007711 [Skeletonema marinoi]|uniref:Uncharacterized protein n=1 Tax=Skeletonema marinoi TaxID=267567 RepID=A0AAD8Y7W4_9STRA|nr:hypothetical protein QTG54_007711 [Skeletonema marinoi]